MSLRSVIGREKYQIWMINFLRLPVKSLSTTINLTKGGRQTPQDAQD